MSTEPSKKQVDEGEQQAVPLLLGLVHQLAVELQTQRNRATTVTLDSSLDRDLRFDSLSRVELVYRIERAFGVSLPEQVLATAETPRDLLRAVQRAPSGTAPSAAPEVRLAPLEATQSAPFEARTFPEVLDWHCQRHPTRTHIYLYTEGREADEISYAALLEDAQRVAAGLRARGLQPGHTAALMLPTGRDYFSCFFGTLLAGGVPVPIYPPARLTQIEDHLRRHVSILAGALASTLITTPEVQPLARLLKSQVPELRTIVTPAELMMGETESVKTSAQPGDIAFLQYTSGSTGNPKGVILTHANLLANIRAIGDAIQVDSTDVFVSWLPLYHDMGLIGAWLGSLHFAYPLVIMSPTRFLTRPQAWLWAIHRHRGTISASPNFGYELCVSKIRDKALEGLDLSSWRIAMNGAEPVSPQTVRRFTQRFCEYGFKQESMWPVYGLAESSLGVTFPPLGRSPIIDRVQREALARSGRAIPAADSDTHAIEFVACGQPLPGHQIRIVSATGRELPERQEGRLQFRGPSATSGYFRNREQTQRLFDGQWLESGDLGYVAGGDLYLTSRIKDIIIRAGRNIYPHEIEDAVGRIPRIRDGCVAVFGSTDKASATERVVILAEARVKDPAERDELKREVTAVAMDLLGTPPDDVVLAPPHTVLKTSSGKIRRAVSRELYEQGRIGKSRAVWWQRTRLALAGVVPQLHRLWHRIVDTLYAGQVWLVFLGLAVIVWPLVVILPRMAWRWWVLRTGGRLFMCLTRTPLVVHGLGHVPEGQACVVVANHASYLDTAVIVTALPIELIFVAKQEFMNNFFYRLFMIRLRTEFVERFDKQKSVEGARRLAQLGSALAARCCSFRRVPLRGCPACSPSTWERL